MGFPFFPPKQNRDLDMFINASKNFNLNITWSTSFAGKMSLSFLVACFSYQFSTNADLIGETFF